jgi:phosphatidate cytidylyltransferase
MLATRLVLGLLMVAGLVFALLIDEWLAPWYPFWFLVSAFAVLSAGSELVSLLGATSAQPSANSVIGGVGAILAANWLPHLTVERPVRENISALVYDPARPLDLLAWPFLTFVAVLMVCFVVQSLQFEKPGRTMAKVSGTVLAVAYVGVLASFTIQMRWFPGHLEGLLALLYLVATAKGADTGAYTLGRLAGRHKLWPALSPHKTIEGAVGGLAFGLVAALIVAALARFVLHVPTFTWPVAAGYGLVVGTVAQLGDLMESMIKRDCERKDASRAVPGFGGVLDVIDSLIFAGPVAYAFSLGFGP